MNRKLIFEIKEEGSGIVRARSNPGSYCIMEHIVISIIDMSKKIGVDTLIEGVETAKQFERLYAMGCKLYQGFYFSKPVDLESFEKQWFD